MLLERAAEHDLLARLGEAVVEILARAKGAAGAGEKQCAAGLVLLGLANGGGKRVMHCLIECIEALRPVEREHAVAGAPFH